MIHGNEKVNILAIGPHPDDIEIGCGATLTKYAAKGHNVFLFIATDGSAGGDPVQRRREQEDSGQIIGAKAIFWGEYEDTRIEIHKEAIDKVEQTIRQVKPDLIFVNYLHDTHQDHRHMAAIATSATRYVRNVLYYETPTTQEFQPNIFVDFGKEHLKIKEKLLLAHASQVDRTNITNLSILEVARSSAHFRGMQARVAYAEAFQSVRLFLNI